MAQNSSQISKVMWQGLKEFGNAQHLSLRQRIDINHTTVKQLLSLNPQLLTATHSRTQLPHFNQNLLHHMQTHKLIPENIAK